METQGDIGERETDWDRHPLQVPHIFLVLGSVIICASQDQIDLPKRTDILTVARTDARLLLPIHAECGALAEPAGFGVSAIHGQPRRRSHGRRQTLPSRYRETAKGRGRGTCSETREKDEGGSQAEDPQDSLG